MIGFARNIRLLPIVLFASACLLVLKVAGLVFSGAYTFAISEADRGDITGALGDRMASKPASHILITGNQNPVNFPGARKSWAREVLDGADVTGSVAAKTEKKDEPGKADAPAKPKPVELPPSVDGVVIDQTPQTVPPGERAILERLQERRKEIDARGRDIDMRESLLKAAERRIEERATELKDIEARANGASVKKDEVDATRFKNLVTMYENMKAKDAAKIFDRLDLGILVQVSTQINPRRMSDILGLMSPEAAEKLTVELATRASSTERAPAPGDLPKIEGHPNGT